MADSFDQSLEAIYGRHTADRSLWQRITDPIKGAYAVGRNLPAQAIRPFAPDLYERAAADQARAIGATPESPWSVQAQALPNVGDVLAQSESIPESWKGATRFAGGLVDPLIALPVGRVLGMAAPVIEGAAGLGARLAGHAGGQIARGAANIAIGAPFSAAAGLVYAPELVEGLSQTAQVGVKALQQGDVGETFAAAGALATQAALGGLLAYGVHHEVSPQGFLRQGVGEIGRGMRSRGEMQGPPAPPMEAPPPTQPQWSSSGFPGQADIPNVTMRAPDLTPAPETYSGMGTPMPMSDSVRMGRVQAASPLFPTSGSGATVQSLNAAAGAAQVGVPGMGQGPIRMQVPAPTPTMRAPIPAPLPEPIQMQAPAALAAPEALIVPRVAPEPIPQEIAVPTAPEALPAGAVAAPAMDPLSSPEAATAWLKQYQGAPRAERSLMEDSIRPVTVQNVMEAGRGPGFAQVDRKQGQRRADLPGPRGFANLEGYTVPKGETGPFRVDKEGRRIDEAPPAPLGKPPTPDGGVPPTAAPAAAAATPPSQPLQVGERVRRGDSRLLATVEEVELDGKTGEPTGRVSVRFDDGRLMQGSSRIFNRAEPLPAPVGAAILGEGAPTPTQGEIVAPARPVEAPAVLEPPPSKQDRWGGSPRPLASYLTGADSAAIARNGEELRRIVKRHYGLPRLPSLGEVGEEIGNIRRRGMDSLDDRQQLLAAGLGKHIDFFSGGKGASQPTVPLTPADAEAAAQTQLQRNLASSRERRAADEARALEVVRGPSREKMPVERLPISSQSREDLETPLTNSQRRGTFEEFLTRRGIEEPIYATDERHDQLHYDFNREQGRPGIAPLPKPTLRRVVEAGMLLNDRGGYADGSAVVALLDETKVLPDGKTLQRALTSDGKMAWVDPRNTFEPRINPGYEDAVAKRWLEAGVIPDIPGIRERSERFGAAADQQRTEQASVLERGYQKTKALGNAPKPERPTTGHPEADRLLADAPVLEGQAGKDWVEKRYPSLRVGKGKARVAIEGATPEEVKARTELRAALFKGTGGKAKAARPGETTMNFLGLESLSELGMKGLKNAAGVADRGITLFKEGLKERGAWVATMVREFGEKIRGHLSDLWVRIVDAGERWAERQSPTTQDALVGAFKTEPSRLGPVSKNPADVIEPLQKALQSTPVPAGAPVLRGTTPRGLEEEIALLREAPAPTGSSPGARLTGMVQRLHAQTDSKQREIQQREFMRLIQGSLLEKSPTRVGELTRAAMLHMDLSEGEMLQRVQAAAGGSPLTAGEGLALTQLRDSLSRPYVAARERIEKAHGRLLAGESDSKTYGEELRKTIGDMLDANVAALEFTGNGNQARKIAALARGMSREGADPEKLFVGAARDALSIKTGDAKALYDEFMKLADGSITQGDMMAKLHVIGSPNWKDKLAEGIRVAYLGPLSVGGAFVSNKTFGALGRATSALGASMAPFSRKLIAGGLEIGEEQAHYSAPAELRSVFRQRGSQEKAALLRTALPEILRAEKFSPEVFGPEGSTFEGLHTTGGAIGGRIGEFMRSIYKALHLTDQLAKTDSFANGVADHAWSEVVREMKGASREAMLQEATRRGTIMSLLHAPGGDEILRRMFSPEQVKGYYQKYSAPLSEIVKEGQARSLSIDLKEQPYFRTLALAAEAIRTGAGKGIGGALLVPFVKTSTNSAIEAMMYSPFGFLQVRRALERGLAGQEGGISIAKFERDVMKPVIGTAIAGSVLGAALNGDITGGGPADPKAELNLRQTGWLPYSIRIGDQYFNYQRVEPLSTILGFAADFGEAFRRGDFEDEHGQVAMGKLSIRTVQSGMDNLVNKSFLAQLEGMFSAISDPERAGERFAKQMTSLAVPNSVGYIPVGALGRAMDPFVRQTTVATAPLAKVPFLSETLPAQVTPYGFPREKSGTAIERLLSPAQRSEQKTDKPAVVAEEMDRIGYVPQKPRPFMTVKGRKVYFTERELGRMDEAAQRAVDQVYRLIRDPQYRNAPDDESDVRALSRKTKKQLVEATYKRVMGQQQGTVRPLLEARLRQGRTGEALR